MAVRAGRPTDTVDVVLRVVGVVEVDDELDVGDVCEGAGSRVSGRRGEWDERWRPGERETPRQRQDSPGALSPGKPRDGFSGGSIDRTSLWKSL